MVENLNIIALVLGVFLSPGLPEGTIEIGKTTCQDAKAILQSHQLQLVDTEYLEILDSRSELIIATPSQRLMAIHTLSYERAAKGWDIELGSGKKSSYFKRNSRPRAGLILCGLFTQPILDEQ